MKSQPVVYILAGPHDGTLYKGVTSHLVRRVWQHRSDAVDGFAKMYGVHRVVRFDTHDSVAEAAQCGKRLKKWSPGREIELIERESWMARSLPEIAS